MHVKPAHCNARDHEGFVLGDPAKQLLRRLDFIMACLVPVCAKAQVIQQVEPWRRGWTPRIRAKLLWLRQECGTKEAQIGHCIPKVTSAQDHATRVHENCLPNSHPVSGGVRSVENQGCCVETQGLPCLPGPEEACVVVQDMNIAAPNDFETSLKPVRAFLQASEKVVESATFSAVKSTSSS